MINPDELLVEQEMVVDFAMEALAEEMHQQGVTRADLSRRLGISRAAVTKLFSGSSPNLRTLVAVAQALNKRVEVRLLDRAGFVASRDMHYDAPSTL